MRIVQQIGNSELLKREKVLFLCSKRTPINLYEYVFRWTVGEDKVLLRMFYADMGIHAIHKRLQRTYQSIYTRIRSITQSENVLKGREFEDYVLTLFNPLDGGELVLKEWQGDKSLGDLRPENNRNPDFVFRYGNQEFAIECKWRERLSPNMEKDLLPVKSIERYRRFSQSRHMSVTIVLGLGGEPCAPEWLYLIPLEQIDRVIADIHTLEEFLSLSPSMDMSLFIRGEKTPQEGLHNGEK